MKTVIQRVSEARVLVGGEVVGEIGPGLVALVCALVGDRPEDAERLAERVARFRCFPDERDRMNRSLLEVAGAVLVVSQFTLAADGRKGRRPSFDAAAPPEAARALVDRFGRRLEALGAQVARGRFGAKMRVELVGDGPVTFVLDEPQRLHPGGA